MPANVNTITVRKVCPVCDEPCETPVEATDFYRWRQGEYVQVVWRDKTPAWRERLVSGTHAKCWAWMFPPDDDEEEGQ